MNNLELSSSFLIGHDVIDAEHADLVEILNNLIDGYKAKDIGRCEHEWHEFCDKLELHFISEEKIMAHFDYVKKDHNARHQTILKRAHAVGKDCKTLDSWEQCLCEIRDDILSQILKHDLYFAEHLITIGYNKY